MSRTREEEVAHEAIAFILSWLREDLAKFVDDEADVYMSVGHNWSGGPPSVKEADGLARQLVHTLRKAMHECLVERIADELAEKADHYVSLGVEYAGKGGDAA